MLPSPAEGGPDRRGAVGHPAAENGFMAAPVAEASRAAETLADASVSAGGCFARPLPLDPTCAGAARSLFREAVAGIGLAYRGVIADLARPAVGAVRRSVAGLAVASHAGH